VTKIHLERKLLVETLEFYLHCQRSHLEALHFSSTFPRTDHAHRAWQDFMEGEPYRCRCLLY